MLGLLAQAEPLPAEMQAPPAAPTPEAAPSPAPKVFPSPTEPTPSGPQSPFKVGFRAGADFSIAADITPEVGYDFSPFLQYEVLRLAQRLGLAVRGEFTFNRFSKAVTIPPDPAYANRRSHYRTLSYFDFAALAVATVHLGRVLPWFGAGTGLTLARLSTYEPQYLPGDWSSTHLLIIGAVGVDVALSRHLQIGLHGEYRRMVNRPSYRLASGESIKPLGDRLAVQAAVMYQF